LAFMGPYSDQTMPWDPNGITGVVRFLKRVRNLPVVESQDAGVQKILHRTVKKVGEDITSMKYNTAIGELMKLMNVLEAGGGIGKKDFHTFLTMLAPFAPELTAELYPKVHEQQWPTYDPKLLVESVVQIPVQINGKVRDVVTIAPDALQDEVVFAARELPNIARYIEGVTITKVIYVPGKLLNLVVE
jgi:leucyl-tRNA synthetase